MMFHVNHAGPTSVQVPRVAPDVSRETQSQKYFARFPALLPGHPLGPAPIPSSRLEVSQEKHQGCWRDTVDTPSLRQRCGPVML